MSDDEINEIVEQLRFLGLTDAADEIDELRALVTALTQQRDTLLGVVMELRAEIARLEACAR